jgi:glycolate oxidase FAD binding subunit
MAANRAMTVALGSPFDVSGAAHVPGSALRADRGGLADLDSNQPVTLLRLEGITASAAHRAASLGAALAGFGTADLIEGAAAAEVWAEIRDCAPFAAQGRLGSWPVWRIVSPPASGGALGMAVTRDCGGEVFYDWGGGLIWAAVAPSSDAGAGKLRPLVDAAGGHATLVRGSESVRREIDVFHPQTAGLAGLSERIRHSFDPKNILNRGRMARGLAT